jgi:hypothetical protein
MKSSDDFLLYIDAVLGLRFGSHKFGAVKEEERTTQGKGVWSQESTGGGAKLIGSMQGRHPNGCQNTTELGREPTLRSEAHKLPFSAKDRRLVRSVIEASKYETILVARPLGRFPLISGDIIIVIIIILPNASLLALTRD